MLTLQSHFEEEAAESFGHAKKVREVIADLDGEAVTTRDSAAIVHTEEIKTMFEEALKTEQAAADQYQKIMPMIKDHPVYAHTIYHILMNEMKAVVEVEALLNR